MNETGRVWDVKSGKFSTDLRRREHLQQKRNFLLNCMTGRHNMSVPVIAGENPANGDAWLSHWPQGIPAHGALNPPIWKFSLACVSEFKVQMVIQRA